MMSNMYKINVFLHFQNTYNTYIELLVVLYNVPISYMGGERDETCKQNLTVKHLQQTEQKYELSDHLMLVGHIILFNKHSL